MKYESLKSIVLEKLEKELSKELFYHSARHTLDVVNVCAFRAKQENLSSEEATLLQSAAVLHDAGFLNSKKEHESEGVKIARALLPKYGYTDSQIEQIAKMILSTKIPQNPITELERIICDADLDYLGREDFYAIGNTLYEELKLQSIVNTEKDWDALQIKFLTAHKYHTAWSIKEREPVKEKYLKELKKKWNVE